MVFVKIFREEKGQIENEKDQINGIAWRVEKSLYKIDDITLHNFYFCLSDNFAKDFKAQKLIYCSILLSHCSIRLYQASFCWNKV